MFVGFVTTFFPRHKNAKMEENAMQEETFDVTN